MLPRLLVPLALASLLALPLAAAIGVPAPSAPAGSSTSQPESNAQPSSRSETVQEAAAEREADSARDGTPESPSSPEETDVLGSWTLPLPEDAPLLDPTTIVVYVLPDSLAWLPRVTRGPDAASPADVAAILGAIDASAFAPTPVASATGGPLTPGEPSVASDASSALSARSESAGSSAPSERARTLAESANRLLQTPQGKAAAASAAIAIPALVGFALYSRLTGKDALASDVRRKLLEAMSGAAGLGVEAACAITGTTYTTASYHLERLVDNGFAIRETHAGRVLYFANGGAFDARDRAAIALIRQPETMRVLADVLANPGTYRAAVAARLGVSATAVGWHLKRLASEGLLAETREGREKKLSVNASRLAELAPAAEKLARFEPSAPRMAFTIVSSRANAA